MLYRFDQLEGTALLARDGKLGKVEDLYFDDRDWMVRYLVADTGGWFSTRRVLLSPASVERFDHESGEIQMDLTQKQIEDSPPLGTEKTVSRKMEAAMAAHYDWPAYWNLPSLVTGGPVLAPSLSRELATAAESERDGVRPGSARASEDCGLRSAEAVKGYDIRAEDGWIGHVDGFVYDSETWKVRYLIIDTRKILPGKKVLIPPSMIRTVSWDGMDVTVMARVEEIRTAPAYRESEPITPEDERNIVQHYLRPESVTADLTGR
ncbi:MAG: PRC-barrel domain-containing protein [Candidatus Eisenbacteria bacterium]